MSYYITSWNHDILPRAQRAMGRGLIGIAERVVVDGKRNAHVITGTLRRSIHAAPVNYNGSGDEGAAQSGDIANTDDGELTKALEVGSWVPYACVEETGRGHQFMTPAVSMARTYADDVMIMAFKQEGL